MELQVVGKGGKYTVQDSTGRLIYSIKKKGFGPRYNLLTQVIITSIPSFRQETQRDRFLP